MGIALLVALVAAGGWWRMHADANEQAVFPRGEYAYVDGDQAQLFRVASAIVATDPGDAPLAKASGHPIRISRDAARTAASRGFVPVVLPDNTRYDVRFEREEFAGNGDWTFIGRVPTPFGELASVLTFGPDGVFGTLPAPDGRMFQITTSHGMSSIAIAGDVVPPGQDPAAPDARDFLVAASEDGRETRATALHAGLASHGTVPMSQPFVESTAGAGTVDVDLLGVYTTDLVALRGSVLAVETEFTNLVAIANQAHEDSASPVRLQLVGMVETDYPPDRDNHRALEEMTANEMPDGFDVHAAREDAQADLVAMLRPLQHESTTCGVAWLNGGFLTPQYTHREYGYSVNAVAPCGPLVLAHELGHNLGSHHDVAATQTFEGVEFGAFPFSYGYRRGDPGGFATVMAYTRGEPWIGRFSDPLAMDCPGARCGTPDADNVRSLARMAGTIANFSTPPGTLSINDTFALESDTDGDDELVFILRLSSPAPAGGAAFDISTRDGTAIAGEDYVATAARMTIPPGGTQAEWRVRLVADGVVEPTEHMEVVVGNLVGAKAGDMLARGTIDDDDPRVHVRGRVSFPVGLNPQRGVLMVIEGANNPLSVTAMEVQAPGYEFDVRVRRGAHVVLTLDLPAPLVPARFDLGVITRNETHDLRVKAPLVVQGRVLFPEGLPHPEDGVHVQATSTVAWGSSYSYGRFATPPDFEYELRILPDALVELQAFASAPYVTQYFPLGRPQGDTVFDIQMRTVPGMHLWGSEIPEGDGSYSPEMGSGVTLSAPAGAGGVSYDVEVFDGTATVGVDYTATGGSYLIAAGEEFGEGVAVTVIGDRVPEEDETVFAKLSNITGAWAPQPVSDPMWIYNDDPLHKVGSDINGDGFSDLFWRSSNVVSWWMLNSNGIKASRRADKSATEELVAMANFYGDSFEDLLWIDESSGVFWLWQSVYDDYVKDPLDWRLPGPGWRIVASADVDGDGDDDMLLHDPAEGSFQWWLLDDRDIATSHSVDVPADWRLLAAGDLDGDGMGDLVWRDPGASRLVLWRGQASGEFADGIEIVGYPGGDWILVDAVDIDGDERDDLVWHSAAAGSIAWWRMQGPERIGISQRAMPTGFRLIGTDDYNGDGRADMAWFDPVTRAAWAWLSDGDDWTMEQLGHVPAGARPLPRPGLPDSVTGNGGRGGRLFVGDAGGDGQADLLWHSRSQRSIDAWAMQGNRRMALIESSAPADGEILATADLDGDGRADFVAADADARKVRAWLSRGDGAPVDEEPIGVLPTANWHLSAVGDLDGNGTDDLLWVDERSSLGSAWRMDGSAIERRDLWKLPAGHRPFAIASFDGEGKGAIATRDSGGGIHVVRQAVRGGLAAPRKVGSLPGPGWVVAGTTDVDGNGSTDFVLHEPATGGVRIWKMDGATRAGEDVFEIPAGYHVVDVADFDGEGEAGILVRDQRHAELWLWRQVGGNWTRMWAGEYPREPLEHPGIAR